MARLASDPVFPRLKDFVIEKTGLAYYSDKDADLASRVERRMSNAGIADGAAYLALLREDPAGPAELDALIAEMTVGETFFFRHSELFDALRDHVFPALIRQNQRSRRLRIWSAGCATGAEPYSLAILLKRAFARQVAGWEVSITGTDINRKFLARAREGRFEAWALRATPDDLRRACFSQAGSSWIVAPEYREWISFQYHNLVTDPLPSLLNGLMAFDLIICRNVMIYFRQAVCHRLVAQFHQCLVGGGWLAVGHAESNVEFFRSYRTVNVPGVTVYQKPMERAGSSGASSGSEARKRTGTSDAPKPFSPPVPGAAVRAEKTTPTIKNLSLGKGEKASSPSLPTIDEVRLLAGLGEYDEALGRCRELLQSEALNPRLHFYRALVLEHLGNQEEAERSLRHAIYLDRRFVLAHYYLGLFLQKRENPKGAARAFQNALRLLSPMDDESVVGDGEDLRASDLKKLTEMHLEVLNSL